MSSSKQEKLVSLFKSARVVPVIAINRIEDAVPLARALVGKKKGASVEVVTPGGAKAYEVMKVEWK